MAVYDGLRWHRSQKEDEERKAKGRGKRLSKDAKAARAAADLYDYVVAGPPDAPAYDAEAEAAEAVEAIAGADVVLTTYLVGYDTCVCVWMLCFWGFDALLFRLLRLTLELLARPSQGLTAL